MNVKQTLAQAYARMREKKSQEAIERFNTRWAELKPLFEDYLNDMNVAEIAKKHHIVARTEFYILIKQYGLPKIDARSTQKFVKNLKKQRKANIELLIAQLKACDCVSCHWIVERLEKEKRGLIVSES